VAGGKRTTLVASVRSAAQEERGRWLYRPSPRLPSPCVAIRKRACLLQPRQWKTSACPNRARAKRLDPNYTPVPHEEKRARRVKRIMAFALPALCDACGTTLMNVGLFFT
jgi:hypothetical protein